MAIEVSEWWDAVAWENALLILAVRRCQPFLLEAGIPDLMASDPRSMRRSALGCLQAKRRLLLRAPNAAVYGMELGRVLSDALASLASAYGEGAAEALYRWAQRHFVDQSQENLLWEWNMVFPRLADVWGKGLPPVPSPLGANAARRFVRSVRERYSREIERDLEDRLRRAAAVPLTRQEQRLLTYRVAGPEGSQQQDILQNLGMVLKRERAHRIWTEVAAGADRSDLEGLLQWVRAETAEVRSGLPPEAFEVVRMRPYLPLDGLPRHDADA